MSDLQAFYNWFLQLTWSWQIWSLAFLPVIAFLFTALIKAKKLKLSTVLFKFDYEAKSK